MRLDAARLVAHDTLPVDIKRRRHIVKSHGLLRVLLRGARHGHWKSLFVEEPLQPLRVGVEADQQERDAGVALVFLVDLLEVR
jgi:hypothetical protein